MPRACPARTKNHSETLGANRSRIPGLGFCVGLIVTLAAQPHAATAQEAAGDRGREPSPATEATGSQEAAKAPGAPEPGAPEPGAPKPGAPKPGAPEAGSVASDTATARSLVKPERSGFRGFEDRGFGVGVFRERTQYRTRRRYETRSLGAAISYDQHIRGPWTGGLLARWSVWEPQGGARGASGDELERVAPLALYTRMSFTPRLPWLWGSTVDGLVRPFGVGGLGYLAFFEDRPSYRKSDQETSETALTVGGGVRFVWPGRASLRLSFERWRGLRTFRYSAVVWKSEVQFGDVDAL